MTNTIYAKPVSIFDDWGAACVNAVAVEEKPKEYLEFNTPPLAILVSMLEAGKEQWQIVETIKSLGMRPDIITDPAVTRQHQKTAAKIYEYFAKKYTLRRLKNEHISEYMMAVEELCENRTRMDAEHLGILVTLPKFYRENQELESLMKASKPLVTEVSHSIELDETVEFVKSIDISRKRGSVTHYFWRRLDGTLLRTVSKTHDIGNSAWACLAHAGKIKVKIQHGQAARIQGYDFAVLNLYHPVSISLAD